MLRKSIRHPYINPVSVCALSVKDDTELLANITWFVQESQKFSIREYKFSSIHAIRTLSCVDIQFTVHWYQLISL